MAELLRSGKKLEQLRVAELKEELDKRGLSKSGIKLELVKRLRQAMSEEAETVKEQKVEPDSFDTEAPNDSSQSEEGTSSKLISMDDHDNEISIKVEMEINVTEDEIQPELDEPAVSPAKDEAEVQETKQEVEMKHSQEKSKESATEETEISIRVPKEGTPLQDEDSLLKREQKDLDDKAVDEGKDPDPVIDLHVSDAIEMIDEDITCASISETETAEGDAATEGKEVPSEEPYSPNGNLWVSSTAGTLKLGVRAMDLKQLFSDYGTVISARIVSPKSHRFKRVGFVTMKDDEEAEKCIKELHLTEWRGHKLLIEFSKHPPRVEYNKRMEIRNANEQQSRSERGKREGSGSSTTASPSKGESKISDSKTPLEGSDHESSRRDSDKERKRDNRDHDKDTQRRPTSPVRTRPRPRRPSPSRRRGRSRSPHRQDRRVARGKSPQYRNPDRERFEASKRVPFDGRGRGLLPDPYPNKPRDSMNRFEGRLEPRPDIIIRTTEELFQRELTIQRHEKRLSEQLRVLKERELKGKSVIDEHERKVRERERELMERERRDRQMREDLERDLKRKAMKEKELIDREKKILEEQEKALQAKEERLKLESLDRERMLEEKERQLREKERQIAEAATKAYHSPSSNAVGLGDKRAYSGQSVYTEPKRPSPGGRITSPYAMASQKPTSDFQSGNSGLWSSPSSNETSNAYGSSYSKNEGQISSSGAYRGSSGGTSDFSFAVSQSSSSNQSESRKTDFPSSTASYGGYSGRGNSENPLPNQKAGQRPGSGSQHQWKQPGDSQSFSSPPISQTSKSYYQQTPQSYSTTASNSSTGGYSSQTGQGATSAYQRPTTGPHYNQQTSGATRPYQASNRGGGMHMPPKDSMSRSPAGRGAPSSHGPPPQGMGRPGPPQGRYHNPSRDSNMRGGHPPFSNRRY